MSNQIKTIATSTAASWTESLTIEGASGDLVFHVVGGTFSDGNTQKTVSPIDSKYTIALTGNPPTDQGTTQIVSVYYEQANEWQIAQGASRILVLPQTREIDFRIQRSGFGVLPKGASLSTSYNGLAVVGETKIPSGTDFKNVFQTGGVKRLDQMASGIFDTTKSPFIAHDRVNGIVYFLNAADTLNAMTVGATLSDTEDEQIVQVFERLNGTAREFTVFYRSGRVEVYDKGMNFLSQANTGIAGTQRVVYRRKNVGTNGTADTYVVFDTLGAAHTLNASYAQTSVLSDQFYTDASDSFAVLCTRSGRLVGSNTSNQPQGFAFYQFVPGTLIAVGVNVATGAACQFNIRDNSLYAPSRSFVQDNRVLYNAPADWSPTGTGLTGGLDTDGTNDLIRFADGTNTAYTNTGFSYLGIYGTPYASDSSSRRFYALARPTTNLAHLNTRDYTATIPEFDQAGSTNVSFSMTVETADADIPLEIRFPDGVTWTATVNGKPVKYVQNGDVVQFNVSHPNITRHSFAFTIGRSSGLFELKPDTMPDAFDFADVSGIAEGEVYDTEEITITGINTKVPVTVTVNGQPATDNVQIFIDGVEATEPFMIANNGKLRLEVLHEGASSRVVVTVGSGSADFGIFTVPEPILNTIRNWAYQAKGVEVVSDAITNPGPQRVILTLTDATSALFANGTKTVTLQTGQSTTIAFTPEENKQYHVVFNTEQHQYDWQVWTDAQWLDPQPATQRAERYVLGDSGDIKFDAIPDNFYTHIRVPAGILLQINSDYVDLPLDVRGVYKAQTEVRNLKCSTTTLRMEGLPSHDQPHTILLGDARLEWLYDFVEDPTYEGVADKYIEQTAVQFVPVVSDAVTQPSQAYQAQSSYVQTAYTQQYGQQEGQVVSQLFGRDFTTQRQLVDATWISRFEPHLDGVVSATWQQSFEPHTGVSVSDVWQQLYQPAEDVLPVAYSSSDFEAVWRNQVVETPTNEYQSADAHTGVAEQLNSFMTGIDYVDALMPPSGVRTVHWSKVSRPDASKINFRRSAVTAQLDAASRARYANRPVTGQIDNGSRAQWIQPSVGVGQSNDRVRHVWDAVNWLGIGKVHVVLPTAGIPVDTAQPDVQHTTQYHVDAGAPYWRQAPGLYPQDNWEARWTHVPRITFRYDMYVGITSKPKSYPIAMHGRTVGKTRSYKLDLTPRFAFNTLYKIDGSRAELAKGAHSIYTPTPSAMYKQTPPTYGQDVSAGQRQEIQVRAHITMQQRFIPLATIIRPNASQAKQVQTPKINEVVPAQANRVSDNIIAVTHSQPIRAVVKSIGIPRPVLEVPDTPIDYGEQDPLKQGYFATELAALQNATQVWGHDPTAVYAIKQPNGYWTWAVVVTCENVCGSYGCDTRGYLSGG